MTDNTRISVTGADPYDVIIGRGILAATVAEQQVDEQFVRANAGPLGTSGEAVLWARFVLGWVAEFVDPIQRPAGHESTRAVDFCSFDPSPDPPEPPDPDSLDPKARVAAAMVKLP